MKKFLTLILIIITIAISTLIIVNMQGTIEPLEIQKDKVAITNYYIYGTHFDLEGKFILDDANFEDITLTMYNGKFKDIKIDYEQDIKTITWNINKDEINNGLYLDDLPKGKYCLFIKVTYENEEEEDSKKNNKDEKLTTIYYALDNQSDYPETTYYTLSNFNHKITINSKNDYPTMMFNIEDNHDQNIYDITIDPGHGGMDGGATVDDAKEGEIVMDIADLIKPKLEKEGLTVKLTRSKDQYTTNDVIEEYNEHGRAVIPNEVKSKYTFSLHLNSNDSSKVSGLEVYTAEGINYNLARTLVQNITSETNIKTSSAKTFRIEEGIYTHNYTKGEIEQALKRYEAKNYQPYNVTTKSNYLYMIRETGGILTGAYVDDSNEKVGTNPYYNSNIGNETYLLELGYITNNDDLELLQNNKEKYATAIANAIISLKK